MYPLEVPIEEIVNYLRIANIPTPDRELTPHTSFLPIGEMEDYWQYAVNYGYIAGIKNYMKDMIFRYKECSNKDSLTHTEVSLDVFGDYDFIVFEFPDEETALYFKLKFGL